MKVNVTERTGRADSRVLLLPVGAGVDELVLGVVEVSVQQPLGAVRVTGVQASEDLAVAGQIRSVERAWVGHHVESETQLGEQVAQDLIESGAAGQRYQALVEADVSGAEVLPVLAVQGVLAGSDCGAQRVQGRAGAGGAPGSGALDDRADPVEVTDILGAQLPDEHSVVEPVVKQPFVGEQPEGFPQRVAGDSQRTGDGLLGQPVPGCEVALGDAGTQDNAVLIASALQLVLIPAFGALSDQVGQTRSGGAPST